MAATARQLRALEAVCETFVPDGGPPPAEVAASILEGLDLARPHARRRLLALLSFLALSGFPRRSRRGRERTLVRWCDSGLGQRRAAFQAFRRLVMAHAYGLPSPLWQELAYPGPLGPVADPPPPTLAPITPDGDAELMCDVCVVGSGAGGGPAAAVLAQAGLDVVVLEAGRYADDADFDGDQIPSLHGLYLDGAVLSTEDQGVTLLAGGCLGGGTVVNYTTSFRTPDALRAEWARLGARTFATDAFDRSLDAAAERLTVNTNHNAVSPREQLVERGLTELGWHVDAMPRNVAGCDQGESCGYCGFGCRLGAKQSTVKTWLADAQAAGARILVATEARRVLVSGGEVHGVQARTRGGGHVLVHARAVVVACGALRTPALLRRSGIANPTVGRQLRLHPVAAVAGVFEHEIRPWTGTLQAIYSDELADLEAGYGLKYETAPIHPTTLASFAPWRSAEDAREHMAHLPRLTGLAVLLRDRGAGRVAVGRDGEPAIHYRLAEDDARRMVAGLEGAARILAAAGATRIISGNARLVDFEPGRRGDLEEFRSAVEREGFAPGRQALFSFHQLGSARMGGSAADSACDPEGQVWDVDGLVVCDGSTFPTASGVNPMLTISAVGHMNASALAARLS